MSEQFLARRVSLIPQRGQSDGHGADVTARDYLFAETTDGHSYSLNGLLLPSSCHAERLRWVGSGLSLGYLSHMVRLIDPHALFERVKELWPPSLELGSDPLQTLNDFYWPLSERLGEDDEWLSLGAWAFHQSLREQISTKGQSSDAALLRDGVPFSVFDRNMIENLADDSWSQVRAAYVSLGRA